MDILQSLLRFINKHNLLERGSIVIVGVSGGADSLCLLHALNSLAPEYDLRLHVAHLNHQLRGDKADADANFVRSIAEQWKLPYTIESRDVAAFAQEHKLSIEEAARQVRYGFLIEVASKQNSHTIAVAHNADDQTESVLMHFLRGSGTGGLRGMLPKTSLSDFRFLISDLKTDPQAMLIRPLLEIPRAEIELYCELHLLHPRIDATNSDTTHFRNRLRHELLPTLETYNPNIRSILRRTASVIAAEYEMLEAQVNLAWDRICVEATDELITFHLANFKEQPLAVRRALLRQSIERLRPPLRDVDFVNIEDAIELIDRGQTGDKATLPQGLMLEIGYGSITIAGANESALPDWPLLPEGTQEIAINIPGITKLPQSEWIIEAEILPEVSNLREDRWNAHFAADNLSDSVGLRTRTSIDRFQPQGMPSDVRLKDWMINVKIPRAIRDRLPLIVSNDQIAWVAGFRVGQAFIVKTETNRVVKLTFRKARV
jgi:tRNA(Ile)-lysidine synthase